jgi:hypothetical protein
MDEVMLFHRALSGEGIKRLAAGESPPPEGFVLHLNFRGGKPRDRSPAGNHGKLQGGKAQLVQGPGGDALLFRQPRTPASASKRRNKSKVVYRWTRDIPLVVQAMALAGDTLFVAGPEDVLDEETSFQQLSEESSRRQIAEQQEALEGMRGARLQAIHAEGGETLAEYRLPSPPIFDGLCAAGGRVLLATMDGRVVSFAAAGK